MATNGIVPGLLHVSGHASDGNFCEALPKGLLGLYENSN
jgi:hypothetical protein